MRAGTSASPADRTLFPRKMLIRLAREYGDQLSMKAVIAIAVRRTNFICQNRLLSLIRLSSMAMSRRMSLRILMYEPLIAIIGPQNPRIIKRRLYALPAADVSVQSGPQLIPDAPGTKRLHPSNGGSIKITPKDQHAARR